MATVIVANPHIPSAPSPLNPSTGYVRAHKMKKTPQRPRVPRKKSSDSISAPQQYLRQKARDAWRAQILRQSVMSAIEEAANRASRRQQERQQRHRYLRHTRLGHAGSQDLAVIDAIGGDLGAVVKYHEKYSFLEDEFIRIEAGKIEEGGSLSPVTGYPSPHAVSRAAKRAFLVVLLFALLMVVPYLRFRRHLLELVNP